jgi:subtilisin family serine protease
VNKILLLLPKRYLFIFLFTIIDNQLLAQQTAFRSGVLPGIVNVKFAPQAVNQLSSKLKTITAKSGRLRTGITTLDAVVQPYNAVTMQRVFPYDAKHEQQLQQHGLDLWYKIVIDPNADVKQVAAALSKLPEISVAQPILQKKMNDGYTGKPAKIVDLSKLPPAVKADAFPNDPYFNQQWDLSNTGQHGGLIGADINALKAWGIEKGRPNVIVSVHDVGMDIKHEDLKANIWINETEAKGKPGVDDDLNGYVDDINGYNYAKKSGTIDPDEHATHVAGTIAAISNNGIGISGIAGGTGKGDGVKIMTLKILEGASEDDIALSYIYAANNGAVISQNSWGYSSPGVDEQIIHEAIKYFVAEAGRLPGSPMRGGVVIFAAGNSDDGGDWYPGYYEEVIAVSALSDKNTRAYYSNYGSWVDIAAPGGDQSISTEDGTLSTLPNNRYGYFQGTSMACPHVSGIAALIVSKFEGPGFTADKLKTQLLTAIRDVDTFNPDYAGKLGAGYADTWLALQSNKFSKPDQVKDLKVLSAAQDNIKLAWKVPGDADDSIPAKLYLYYSTEPITADNIAKAGVIEMRNWNNAGSDVEATVPKLKSLTKYYFATRAADRWNNTSDLSNVVSASTSDGPVITQDKTSFAFTIDASTNKTLTAADNFTIENTGKGLLTWNAFQRQKEANVEFFRSKLKYPKTRSLTAHKPKVTRMSVKSVRNIIQPKASAFESQELFYSDFPTNVIGDEDLTLTNSSATKFIVNNPVGFNLTNVSAFLNVNDSHGPVIVEVYKGGDKPLSDNLVYAQEFHAWSTAMDSYSIKLDEQLFFASGESFWVVIHAPSGNKYPLGMGYLNDTTTPENYLLMSFNMGNTWSTLASNIGSNEFAWNVIAQSFEGTTGDFITLEPASGENAAGLSTNVKVNVNAATLSNGNYSNVIVTSSNDAAHKELRIPVTVRVSNRRAVLNSADVVDLGTVFLGKDKTVAINIENSGYGNFIVNDVSSSDPVFSADNPGRIPARGEALLNVTFKPTKSGEANGKITLTDDLGAKHVINMFAICAQPAVVKIEPAERNFDLNIGDTASTTFTIKNAGSFPLKYVAPKFSTKQIDGVDFSKVSTFGYSYKIAADAASSWSEISATGKEISDTFKPLNGFFYPVDLGFSINVFGRKLSKVYITPVGAITFDDQANLANGSTPAVKGDWMPNGYLSATFLRLDLNKGGHIYYKRASDRFIVEFKDVLYYYATDPSQVMTFQIVIKDNGDVQYLYDDIEASGLKDLMFIAAEGFDRTDALAIQSNAELINLTDKSAINITSPGDDIFSAMTNADGVVAYNESKALKLTLNTDSLSEGKHTQNLSILTNDPFTPVAHITVNVNIKGGGLVKLSADRTEIDFGSLIEGNTSTQTVALVNDGSSAVVIDSVSLGKKNFRFTGEKRFTLKPKSKAFFDVSIDSTNKVGDYNDILTFKPASAAAVTVSLKATITPAPAIKVDQSPIKESLAAGETKQLDFLIDNTAGKATLDVIPSSAHWLSLYDKTDTKSKIAYSWTDSKKADGPKFEWIDIIKTGTKIENNGVDDSKEITLPFEIEYYGKKYTKLNIGMRIGAVSFTDKVPTIFFTPDLPNAEAPNALLAPFFEGGYVDIQNNDPAVSGIFYQYYEDRVVISYENYTSLFAFFGGDISFQIILFKNGTIKFQYNNVGTDFATQAWINRPGVGIENEDGTEGIQISKFQDYIQDKLAVVFTPSYKLSIPKGQSKTYALKFDASSLSGGDYNTQLLLQNNTPSSKNLSIPVALVVKGTPMVTVADTIDMGTVMISSGKTTATTYFDISNNGSGTLHINNMAFADSKSLLLEHGDVNSTFLGVDTVWTAVNQIFPATTIDVPSFGSGMFRIIENITKPATFNTQLKITSNDAALKSVNVIGTVAYPPLMSVYEKSIQVQANDSTDVVTRSFTVDNTKGRSTLDYNLNIQYQRTDDKLTGNVFNVAVRAKKAKVIAISKIKSKPLAGIKAISRAYAIGANGASNVLEHDNATKAVNVIGLGEGTAFLAATAFNAGSDGFNLSEVKVYMAAGSMASVPVTIDIMVGNDPLHAKKLHSERFYVARNVPDTIGAYETFKLSAVKQIYPNEKFFVVVNYPIGLAYPQGTAIINTSLPQTFFYFDDYSATWADLTEVTGYKNVSFMVKAVEDNHESLSWVSLPGAATGKVAAGAKTDIGVKFTAAYATKAENAAQVIINSNDPDHRTDSVALSLHLNQAPLFVKTPVGNQIYIKENSDTTVTIKAADAENDAITYTIDSGPQWVTMKADTAAHLNFKPAYNDAGSYTVKVNAVDAYKHVSTYEFKVDVQNANRPPVAIESKTLTLTNGNLFKVKQASYFSDGDNDVLTYSFSSSDAAAIQVTTAGDEFLLNPLKSGQVTVKIIADDHQGGKDTLTLNITIKNNLAPVLTALPGSIVVNISGGVHTVNLNNYFSDPDNDSLSYTPSIDDNSIASVKAEQNQLMITPVKVGDAAISVTADDRLGGKTTTSIVLKVVTDNDESLRCYPNPVQTVTTVAYLLPVNGHVLLRVFTASGRLIKTLVDSNQAIGKHTIPFDMSGLSSGVYFYNLYINEKTGTTQKIIKL